MTSCKSSALSARVRGPWKAAGDETIDWTDFEECTIECVLSYFYTGGYCVEQSGVKTASEKTSNRKNVETATSDAASMQRMNDERIPIRPLTPVKKCLEDEGIPTGDTDSTEMTQESHDALGILALQHAKVYCFACRFLVEDLTQFSLQCLTRVLIKASEAPTCVFPYLSEAMRVVYEETPKLEPREDPARKLFSHFVALEHAALAGEQLDDLLVQGGDLTLDVLRKLGRRVVANDFCVKQLRNQLHLCRGERNDLQRKLKGWLEWNQSLHSNRKRHYQEDDTVLAEYTFEIQ